MQIALKIIILLKIHLTICLLSSVPFLNAQTNSETIEYKVKEHDTLIKILKKHRIKPIYGNTGALAEALKLNPKKQTHNGNLIFVGEILIIPKHLMNTENNKSQSATKIQKDKITKDKVQKVKPIASEINKEVKKEKLETPKKKEEVLFKSNNPFEFDKPQKTEQTQIFKPSTTEIQVPKNNSSISESKEILHSNKQESHNPIANSKEEHNSSNNMHSTSVSIFENAEQLLPDYGHYCKPDPICTIWLWDLNNRCCNLQNSPLLLSNDTGI
ncbi:LysM domain-containing protein [Spirobacillus cienkowskii]|uniref:LysM domain-containing protein n=1 Tax=Spirobacillus cienkowskii TaxID=495820 RepID=UPI0030CADDE6